MINESRDFRSILFGMALMLGSVGLHLLFPLVVQKIIDDVIPKHQFDQLFIFILAVVLLLIGATILQIIDSIIHNMVGGKVTDHLRRSLWKKLLRLSPQSMEHSHWRKRRKIIGWRKTEISNCSNLVDG